MVSLANYKDISALRRLWLLCFPTEEERYLDYFFEHIFPMARCYAVRKESEIIAMAYVLNDSMIVRPAFSYVYAVATHPEFRGLGLMNCLLETIDEDNADLNIEAQILVPATENLEAMYRKIGFKTFNQKVKFDATCYPDDEGVSWFVLPVSPKDYARCRASYLEDTPTFHWSDRYYEHYLSMQRLHRDANFYQIFCADLEGVFFASFDEDTIYIKDVIFHPVQTSEGPSSDPPYTLFSVMNAISSKLGRQKYQFEFNRVTSDMAFFVPRVDALIRYTDRLAVPRWGDKNPYFCLNLE